MLKFVATPCACEAGSGGVLERKCGIFRKMARYWERNVRNSAKMAKRFFQNLGNTREMANIWEILEFNWG
jgi:hypothetical protein